MDTKDVIEKIRSLQPGNDWLIEELHPKYGFVPEMPKSSMVILVGSEETEWVVGPSTSYQASMLFEVKNLFHWKKLGSYYKRYAMYTFSIGNVEYYLVFTSHGRFWNMYAVIEDNACVIENHLKLCELYTIDLLTIVSPDESKIPIEVKNLDELFATIAPVGASVRIRADWQNARIGV